MTYYDVLGIPTTATEDEVKAAWKKAAKKHHPDKNPGDEAAADRFKRAKHAYEVLSDPARRQRYDAPAFDLVEILAEIFAPP